MCAWILGPVPQCAPGGRTGGSSGLQSYILSYKECTSTTPKPVMEEYSWTYKHCYQKNHSFSWQDWLEEPLLLRRRGQWQVVVPKEGHTGFRSLGLQVAQWDLSWISDAATSTCRSQMLVTEIKIPKSEISMNTRDSAAADPQESQTDLWYI